MPAVISFTELGKYLSHIPITYFHKQESHTARMDTSSAGGFTPEQQRQRFPLWASPQELTGRQVKTRLSLNSTHGYWTLRLRELYFWKSAASPPNPPGRLQEKIRKLRGLQEWKASEPEMATGSAPRLRLPSHGGSYTVRMFQ